MTDREMLLMAYTAMTLTDENIKSDVFHQLCVEIEGHLWPPSEITKYMDATRPSYPNGEDNVENE